MRESQNSLKWIVHVNPLPDELLSSWIARSAKIQFTKIHTFCSINWPSVECWTRDIDRWSNQKVIQLMAYKTSTPLLTAENTSLKVYIGKIYKKDPKGFNRYILPWGIWHRKRKLPGLCYCPGCLTKDGASPYFRKSWRLCFSHCCLKCGLILHDRCEFCNAPVTFFRNDFISKTDIPRKGLDQCFNCGKSLAMCSRILASPIQLRLQTIFEEYIDKGYKKYSPKLYFDVLLHLLWCLLTRNKRLKNFQAIVATNYPNYNEIYKTILSSKYNTFHLMEIKHRRILYESSFWLMASFPKRIHWIMLKSNTSAKAILGERKYLPNWFIRTIKDLTNY